MVGVGGAGKGLVYSSSDTKLRPLYRRDEKRVSSSLAPIGCQNAVESGKVGTDE